MRVRRTDNMQLARVLRRHYGLSQTQLATLLDVTRQTVTNWERGAIPMSRIVRYALLYVDYALSHQLLSVPREDKSDAA